MEELLLAIRQAVSRYPSLQDAVVEASDLKEAMVTRQLIERAKSILVERHNLSQSEAIRQLQRISREEGQTIKEAAQHIVTASEFSDIPDKHSCD